MAAPSFDDLFDLGKAEMLLRRPDLFLAPGDVTDFVVAAAAAMADKNIQFAAEEFRKTFIDGATDDDLTTLVDDHFGIQRTVATQAQVILSFSRPTSGAGAGSLLTGFTVSTVEDASGNRQEFTLDADVNFGAADLGPINVAATAVDAGRGGNVGAGTITNMVGAPFDTTVVVTNVAAAGGGNDEETDEQLRERARAFPSTLRRGTLAALEFGALTVPSVQVATATEIAGIATVFVTDGSGNSTAEMVADVITELENWRCAGSNVVVVGGTLLNVNIDVTLVVSAGTSVPEIQADVIAAVTARLAKLPVGNGTGVAGGDEGVLREEHIHQAILGVDPDRIIGVTINTPASLPVEPAQGEVIRAGTVTVN
jgi:uncharacterized phage protein gp47/JayE